MAGIYIHVPFCRQACHYCNFHFSTSFKLKDDVIKAFIKEIEIKQDFFEHDTLIDTIYFGGGTPSALTDNEISDIVRSLYQHFNINDSVEITLEANPDDLSREYLKKLKQIGITRLSIGIQSFDDTLLQYMNRAHDRKEAIQSLEYALAMDFDEVNIDLIYGIPGLSSEAWMKTLSFALKFQVDHISAYALTVEPNTALDHYIKKKNWPSPEDELTAKQFIIASEYLEENDFIHYEISNFSRGERYSKHNTAYWQGKPYLGIGPSAHSFKKGERSWNISNNARYIRTLKDANDPSETEILSLNDKCNEYIMTGLRTKWGIDLNKIAADFGHSQRDHILSAATQLHPDRYTLDNDILTLTKKGWLYSDGICSSLFI